MDLAINLATGRVHAAVDAPPLQLVEMVRGDMVPLALTFFRGAVVEPLPTGAEIRVALKVRGEFASGFLAEQSTWTREDDTYRAEIDLHTTELTTAIAQAPALDTALEVTWAASGTGPRTSIALPVRVLNDYIRGDEGVPINATPAYPLPGEIVQNRNLFRVTVPPLTETVTVDISALGLESNPTFILATVACRGAAIFAAVDTLAGVTPTAVPLVLSARPPTGGATVTLLIVP